MIWKTKQHISSRKYVRVRREEEDMRNARIELVNIFETVLFVAMEGLPYRQKSNNSAVENVRQIRAFKIYTASETTSKGCT